jgi:hypothetical protein
MRTLIQRLLSIAFIFYGTVVWGQTPDSTTIECNHTKCFTAVNGTQEVFNVLGSGRIVTQGEIGCKELQVALDPNSIVWPDYVFRNDYRLPALSEVKAFITTHNHLPGVPSAAEVSCEGVKLGEMNARLLEKVEQLFLYVIELEEQVKRLEAERK